MKLVIFLCACAWLYIAYEVRNAMPYNPAWDEPLEDENGTNNS